MLVYFDESYRAKERLFIGSLFLPTKRKRKILHNQFVKLKRKEKFFTKSGEIKEIKYSKILNSKSKRVAIAAVKLFSQCDNAFFRAVTLSFNPQKLDLMAPLNAPRKLKEAMIYTKATVQLMRNNLKPGTKGILLMDNITRAREDKFDQLIRQKLGEGSTPIFHHIGYVDSKEEVNHLIQICDLLLGAIINEHFPASKLKNQFREKVKEQLGLPSLKGKYWQNKTQVEIEKKHPKFTLRYWEIPYRLTAGSR